MYSNMISDICILIGLYGVNPTNRLYPWIDPLKLDLKSLFSNPNAFDFLKSRVLKRDPKTNKWIIPECIKFSGRDEYSREELANSLYSNSNERMLELLLPHTNILNIKKLCSSHTKIAMAYIKKNIYHASWLYLAYNPVAYELLCPQLKKSSTITQSIYTGLSSNSHPEIVKFMINNFSSINWSEFSSNEGAYDVLVDFPNLIDKYRIFFNPHPQIMDLIKQLCSEHLIRNNMVHLLKYNKSDTVFDYASNIFNIQLTEPLNKYDIDPYLECANPRVIKLFKIYYKEIINSNTRRKHFSSNPTIFRQLPSSKIIKKIHGIFNL